jgi:glycerol uptake facilitator-like aquaporin
MMPSLPRAAAAEALGSAALLAIVVGSGIMAERLAMGNTAVALLANTLATGFGLYVLITLLAPLSGAHFNPAVSMMEAFRGHLDLKRMLTYWLAQWGGAIGGVWLAHLMFDLPILQLSHHARAGTGQFFSEIVATCGLMLVILGVSRHSAERVAAAVAAYIASAYWFTASTSFANPAVTTARMLTDSFAGILAADAPAFIAAQVLGVVAALAIDRALWPAPPPEMP